ncbi:MAG: ATP-binding protein [Proteobacteria bacterium]|nr:ATP-binding protein [Pseudomonadota bacterium]
METRSIGLAIVKKAVEMQNGRVWIESEVNRGCKFYLLFLLPG